MFSWIVSCLLITITLAYSKAIPIPQNEIDGLSNQVFGSDDLFLGASKRTGRQGYYYDDFFSFPSEYSNGLSYSDYYSSYYDPSYYAPRPRPPAAAVPAYVPYKKTSHRRQGGFGPTTQKYTVWDLA